MAGVLERSTALLVRNICVSALNSSKDFARRHQRVQVAIIDETTVEVKVFTQHVPLAQIVTITVTSAD